jgi:hypothetical protein
MPLRYFTLIGLVFLGTALLGHCPAYTLFGWNTCRNIRPRVGG